MKNFVSSHIPLRLIRHATLSLLSMVMIVGCSPESHSPTTGSSARPKNQAEVTPGEWTVGIKESGSRFTCTVDTVLIGRKHSGDENANTHYKCATLSQFGKPVTTDEPLTSDNIKESGSEYVCPTNMVMVGREHDGDENGNTRYKCAFLNGPMGQLQVAPGAWSAGQAESDHSLECAGNQVLVGRKHDGDENGHTYHKCATLW
ncbi:hypothetical protein [Pseudomonas sp. QTF5]|uniref:hypothetical protein n=1 Tax=Pseudomonas sp. QTF5 TaxID=1435425 RepID=UPI001179B21A|nr:hypothetical protein [Pseudomonas sp. QTF5]